MAVWGRSRHWAGPGPGWGDVCTATHAYLRLILSLVVLVGVVLFWRLHLTFPEILIASQEVLMDSYWFPASLSFRTQKTPRTANLMSWVWSWTTFGYRPGFLLFYCYTLGQQTNNTWIKRSQEEKHGEVRALLIGNSSKIYCFLSAATIMLDSSQIKRWIELKWLST